MDNSPIVNPPEWVWHNPSCKSCGELIDLDRRRRHPQARTCGATACQAAAAAAANRRRVNKYRRKVAAGV